VQATCSNCYNFNNYMTNMWNRHTKVTSRIPMVILRELYAWRTVDLVNLYK
jgi:hypothetical protein